ncbi:MAG: hypothetical protein NTZ49_01630 [Candidatus Parcubacteria bacterium]|nr:hypothetical protein [Candidatus Parcubacteria bacterium]
MRNQTSTKSKIASDVDVQLAIATAVLLGVSALAFLIMPALNLKSSDNINFVINEPSNGCYGLMGDLNGNGVLDEDDQAMIAAIISGTASFNPCADLEGSDGIIGPGDLAVFKTVRIKQDTPLCTDSDGGREYFTSGSVTSFFPSQNQYESINDVCRNTTDGGDIATGKFLIEGTCEENGGTGVMKIAYECPNGCKNGACIPSVGDTRKFLCQPKPKGTDWNTVGEYTQTWTGATKWQPIGSAPQYNTEPSATSCRYICASDYQLNEETGQCLPIPLSQTLSCGYLFPGEEWIGDSTYVSTWNGTEFLPIYTKTYNLTPGTCNFKCISNYVYDNSYGKCKPSGQTRKFFCGAKPANTVWSYPGSSVSYKYYVQGLNTATNLWVPVATPTIYATIGTEYDCNYKCSPGYITIHGLCISSGPAPITNIYYCGSLPENAEWNSVGNYTQQWSGTSWVPPVAIPTYSTTSSNQSCNYKCKSGFVWDGGTCKSQ